jgi:hypothetical protein
VPREELEVGVERVDEQIATNRHGADQEIGVGALHPARATAVVHLRSLLVVLAVERDIGKRRQALADELKLLPLADPGENLLANCAKQANVAATAEPFDDLGDLQIFTPCGARPTRSACR